MQARVRVVIPTRTPSLALKCVASLAGQVDPDDIVVVATSDAAASILRQAGGFRLTVDVPFRGYGAACNVGAKGLSAHDVLIFSNDDVVFHEGSIDSLATALQGNPRAGLIGPKVIDPNGGPDKHAGLRPLQGWLFWPPERLMLPDRLHRSRIRILHALAGSRMHFTGPVLAIRAKAFRSVEGFDEDIFMFFEEADLAQRCAERGLSEAGVADTQVTHIGGATHGETMASLQWHQTSLLDYAHKHWNLLQRSLHFCLSAVILACNLILVLLRGLFMHDGDLGRRFRLLIAARPRVQILRSPRAPNRARGADDDFRRR